MENLIDVVQPDFKVGRVEVYKNHSSKSEVKWFALIENVEVEEDKCVRGFKLLDNAKDWAQAFFFFDREIFGESTIQEIAERADDITHFWIKKCDSFSSL